MAALIHDIGKIYVPSDILSKPGRLSEVEFELIKTHPQIGYEIMKKIEFPWPIAEITFQHHERIDGSGYPRGLSSSETLMEAKILGVADVVEAMVSHRPYRPAFGLDKVIEEILKSRGILYDPEVADACVEILKKDGAKFD
jgi:HD-GYP domain-containing protein (c-di-GMP phosphodiesterase class II)